MENGENNKNKGNPNVNCRHYREEMERAAKDDEFIQDNKEVIHDFAAIDKEMSEMSADDFSSYEKPTYGRDEKGVFRLYPDGHKKHCREKKFRMRSRQPLNPPLEAIHATMKRAIAEIHAAGLSTVHCDDRGRIYLLYPDGRKKYCTR